MIHLIQGSPSEFIAKNPDILEETYKESGQIGTKVNVNTAVYKTLENGGYLLGIGIMDDDMFIGYSTITAMPGMHNADKLIALVDILYIKPEHRSYKTFKYVITSIEEHLKRYGVQVIQMSSPIKRDISKLLERVKYKPLERVYFKSLE